MNSKLARCIKIMSGNRGLFARGKRHAISGLNLHGLHDLHIQTVSHVKPHAKASDSHPCQQLQREG